MIIAAIKVTAGLTRNSKSIIMSGLEWNTSGAMAPDSLAIYKSSIYRGLTTSDHNQNFIVLFWKDRIKGLERNTNGAMAPDSLAIYKNII